MNENTAQDKILCIQNNQSTGRQYTEKHSNTATSPFTDQTRLAQVNSSIDTSYLNASEGLPQSCELKTVQEDKNAHCLIKTHIEQEIFHDELNPIQYENSNTLRVFQTESYEQISRSVQLSGKFEEVVSSREVYIEHNSYMYGMAMPLPVSPDMPTEKLGEQTTSFQVVKLTLMPAKKSPLIIEPEISTKLIFEKNNMPGKPKGMGYFQMRVLDINSKKEDDPFSLHKVTRQEMSNVLNIELLPGEQIVINEDTCLIADKRNSDGKIVVTNYQLNYISQQLKRIKIPLGYIGKLQRMVETRPVVYSTIDVTLKIGTVLKFKFTSKDISINIFKTMGKLIYCDVGEVFAFSHARSRNHTNIATEPRELAILNGWDVDHQIKDFKRMGISVDEESPFRIINNVDGRVCVSYPKYFLIPAKVTDELMRKSLRTLFRDRGPALSYAIHLAKSNRFVCIWRSSQAKPNMLRNLEYQEYVKYLGNLTKEETSASNDKDIMIFDWKQKISSVGTILNPNSMAFPIENYRNADIVSREYESLAALRESYNKLIAACCLNEPTKWLSLVEQCRWYQYVFALLRDAFLVSEYIQNAQNVLLQCCQGTDRTPQVAALVQIILDPYYRTVQGFSVLIEKEFVSFGHPFGIRLGLKKEKQNDERAPVFIQFLDAVSQLIKQYPLSFEYTTKYLARIGFELYTNRYGNFLCSNESEQLQNKILQETLSIWTELRQQNNVLYTNPYFVLTQETDMYELRSCISIKTYQFFREHFLKLTSELKDDYQTNENAEQNQDYSDLLHKQLRLDIDGIKQALQKQQLEINRLRNQLAELQQQKQSEE